MTDTSSPPHLGDSELLHMVDGDASAFEMDRWSQHLLACPQCSERLRLMGRRSGNLSALLGEIQLPENFAYPRLPGDGAARGRPRREARAQASWLRAAAVVLLLAAPLLLVRPLRAWVSDRLGAGWERVATWVQGEPEADAPPAPAPESGSRILFSVTGPIFLVEVSHAQPSGRLWIRASESDEGSLTVADGADEIPVVLERGVRIVNPAASAASYQLVLPRSVERVRIRVAGRLVATVAAAELREGVVVPLTGAAAR